MHDPMTVAFEFGEFLTIWHRDPESDGTDDSCWKGRAFKWGGWRWHIWHWRIQIHPLLFLKRWLFSKCKECGKGFKWRESPISENWDSTGPLWFRSEKGIYHQDCT